MPSLIDTPHLIETFRRGGFTESQARAMTAAVVEVMADVVADISAERLAEIAGDTIKGAETRILNRLDIVALDMKVVVFRMLGTQAIGLVIAGAIAIAILKQFA